METWRNSAETHQSGHALRPRSEIKIGRSSAKDDALERPQSRTIKEASQILQSLQEKLPFAPSHIISKRTKEGCDHGSEVGTAYSGQGAEGPVSLEKTEVKEGELGKRAHLQAAQRMYPTPEMIWASGLGA